MSTETLGADVAPGAAPDAETAPSPAPAPSPEPSAQPTQAAEPEGTDPSPESSTDASPDTPDTQSPAPEPEGNAEPKNDGLGDAVSIAGKLSGATPLGRVLTMASVLQNERKIPSAEALKSHLTDFKKMFDDRDSNPNFDSDMKNMMEGSKKLLKSMRDETNQIMREGKPAGKDQANELAQWIMDIARNFLSNKNGLSSSQVDTVKSLENGMKMLGTELTDISKKMEKHHEDLILKQDGVNTPTPGMPK